MEFTLPRLARGQFRSLAAALFLLLLVLFGCSRERGLKDVAPEGMKIGVAVHPNRLANPAFAAQVRHDFNSVVPEVALKHEWIHPCPPRWLVEQNPSVAAWISTYSGGGEDRDAQRDCREDPSEWNWEPMDAIVRWANANDVGVYMHPLVWHSQNPGWLTHPSITLTAEELDRVMREHIDGIIAHYCEVDEGSIYAYNVVNEAVAEDGTLYSGGPWPAIGDDYVYRAFLYASEALEQQCPDRDIKLFYNDHGFEFGPFEWDERGQPASWAAGVYALLETLQSGERPLVDGLGMQSHLRLYQAGQPPAEPYTYTPLWEPKQMTEVMNIFSRTFDIEIHISELDVSLRRWREVCDPDAPRPPLGGGDCPITDPDPRELFDEQAEWFRNAALACLQAERCTGLQVWGLADNLSWLRDFRPTMFELCPDDDMPPSTTSSTYCPKPAYRAVYEVLDEPRE
ncbi:MAG: endo-1,4-beta-xylanase [Chloroflexota bacterium]|nr:endo-1,4-beta-xylanase [Chloroflexota bacterium]